MGKPYGDDADEPVTPPEDATPVGGSPLDGTTGDDEPTAEVQPSPDDEGRESDPVLAAIMEDLAAVTRERDEFLETAQRLQAEFKNYRERVARQQAEAGQAAVASFVTKLLPALDTLNLALAHARAEGSEETTSALAQVHGVFHEVLTKEGLEVVEPIGKRFDPTEADAVAHEEGEGEPTVTEVFRAGYRWRGQVIRPAMVRVSGS